MRVATNLLMVMSFSVGLVAGCALDGGSSEDTCEVTCSTNGACQDGNCICSPGFEGNPYAQHGCRPVRPPPDSTCDEGCGQKAYCSSGQCICEQGAISVCGTGDCTAIDSLCDGVDDCLDGADEDVTVCNPPVFQDWLVTDSCDDGLDIGWRIWSEGRNWVWPSGPEPYWTRGLDVDVIETIECAEGQTICFGGSVGELLWGVGVDGNAGCEDCCATCGPDLVDVGYLTCL